MISQYIRPIEEPYVTDDGTITERLDTLETHAEIDLTSTLIDEHRFTTKSNLSPGVFQMYPTFLFLGYHPVTDGSSIDGLL